MPKEQVEKEIKKLKEMIKKECHMISLEEDEYEYILKQEKLKHMREQLELLKATLDKYDDLLDVEGVEKALYGDKEDIEYFIPNDYWWEEDNYIQGDDE